MFGLSGFCLADNISSPGFHRLFRVLSNCRPINCTTGRSQALMSTSPLLDPGKAVVEKCVKVSNIVQSFASWWKNDTSIGVKFGRCQSKSPKSKSKTQMTERHLTKINLGLRQHNLRKMFLHLKTGKFQFSYSDRGIYRSGNTVFSWQVLAPEWTSVCYIFLPPPPSCSMLKHLRGARKSTLHSCNLGNRL